MAGRDVKTAGRVVGIAVCFWLASLANAAFVNVEKIDELSMSAALDYSPVIQENELRIIFTRMTIFPGYAVQILEATRASVSDPFGTPSADAFVNVVSPGIPSESPTWLSSDGLRLCLLRSDPGSGDADIYVTSRTLATEPFAAPALVANVNDPIGNDLRPVMANGERSLYFHSDRNTGTSIYEIFRATRPDTNSVFSAPTVLSEFGTSYVLLDVSEDELSLLLTNLSGRQVFLAERSSPSAAFGTPVLVQEWASPAGIANASVNNDFTRIYYGWTADISSVTEADLYEADLTSDPPPTPTPSPTPTPVPPLPPQPPIELVAGPDGLLQGASETPNPFGGVFDSQGRFVFFDQLNVSGMGTIGNNRLMRLTPGSPPTFEILATENQLATADSDWTKHSYGPFVTGFDLLSDDSVVMVYHTWGYASPKIIKIVPGTPPQISLVASLNDLSVYTNYPIAVDRAVTPNIIYLGRGSSIYSIAADASNGTPALWHTFSVENSPPPIAEFGPPLIIVDRNRDLIAAVAMLDTLVRINSTTKAETSIVPLGINPQCAITYMAARGLAVDPKNGNLMLLAYSSGYPYPGTSSVNNLIKLTRNSDSDYAAADYLVEVQLLDNEDIAALTPPVRALSSLANGISFHPSADWLYITSGSPLYYTYPGYQAVIGVGTNMALGVVPAAWNKYR